MLVISKREILSAITIYRSSLILSPLLKQLNPEGIQHENRVKWVDDGEEYFVVLTDQ